MSTLISSVPSTTISIPLSHWLSKIPSPGSSLIFSRLSPCTTTSAKSSVGLYCNKQHNSKEQQSKQTALHCDGWEDSRGQDWGKLMSQCAFVGWKISRSGRDPPGQIVLPWQIKYVGVNWSINAIFHPHIRKLKTGGTLKGILGRASVPLRLTLWTCLRTKLGKVIKVSFCGEKNCWYNKIDRS